MNYKIAYKGFISPVKVSMEDKVLYGKVTNKRDNISFEGKTIEELKFSFREAIDDYLLTLKSLKSVKY